MFAVRLRIVLSVLVWTYCLLSFLVPTISLTWSSSNGIALARPAIGRLSRDQITAVLDTLADAKNHAIGDPAFETEDVKSDLASADGKVRDGALEKLQRAVIQYAEAQHGFRIKSEKFERLWAIRPPRYEAAKEFRRAVTAGNLAQWLASLPPPFAEYQQLQRAYASYSKIAANGGWKKLSRGPDLREGDRGARTRALRVRLASEYPEVVGDQTIFNSSLTDAVKRFQRLHGLPESGVVSAETLKALNVSAQDRANEIALNMERWRWLPRERSANRVEVNIAAAALDAYADDKVTLHMLAAAGKPEPDDMTPMLTSKITSVTFNPAWIVPHDIAARELFPKERRERKYFEREGFKVESGKLVQQPGPENALGRIKFMFPNPFSVYLHDTPHKSAFSRSHRSVSHGCVRLERPLDLAKLLLAGSPKWTDERIDQALAVTDTARAQLNKPIAVMLLYWTAYPGDEGIAFRDDVYHWDKELAQLLGNRPNS